MQINRRKLLIGLVGLGATINHIKSIEVINDSEIDEVWHQFQQNPWYFNVSKDNTIQEDGVPDLKIRSDIYHCICVEDLRKSAEIIKEVDRYEELRSHFVDLANDEFENILDLLEEPGLSRPERQALHKLRNALENQDEGWREWVDLIGDTDSSRFRAEIKKWLDGKIDWQFMDYWPDGWSPEGNALVFFRDTAADISRKLGVKVIEGEHPGSTYYAAELCKSIEEANLIAVELSLPFRFRRLMAYSS